MSPPEPAGWVRSLVWASAALVVVVLAGCDPLGDFRQREVVVKFEHDTPQSVRMKVRADCSGLPRATPVPVETGGVKSERVNNVRYDVDDATGRDLTRLYQCLNKHPSVLGVSRP